MDIEALSEIDILAGLRRSYDQAPEDIILNDGEDAIVYPGPIAKIEVRQQSPAFIFPHKLIDHARQKDISFMHDLRAMMGVRRTVGQLVFPWSEKDAYPMQKILEFGQDNLVTRWYQDKMEKDSNFARAINERTESLLNTQKKVPLYTAMEDRGFAYRPVGQGEAEVERRRDRVEDSASAFDALASELDSESRLVPKRKAPVSYPYKEYTAHRMGNSGNDWTLSPRDRNEKRVRRMPGHEEESREIRYIPGEDKKRKMRFDEQRKKDEEFAQYLQWKENNKMQEKAKVKTEKEKQEWGPVSSSSPTYGEAELELPPLDSELAASSSSSSSSTSSSKKNKPVEKEPVEEKPQEEPGLRPLVRTRRASGRKQ